MEPSKPLSVDRGGGGPGGREVKPRLDVSSEGQELSGLRRGEARAEISPDPHKPPQMSSESDLHPSERSLRKAGDSCKQSSI